MCRGEVAGYCGKAGVWSLGGLAADSIRSLPSRSEPPSLPVARAQASSLDWRARVRLAAWLWRASNGM